MVKQHWSANSCSHISELFKHMFEDSDIVKKFSMGRTKAAYMIISGLAPYFKDELTSTFVICFDEASNRVIQQGQIDIFIQYYDDQCGMLMASYFGSVLLRHSTAVDLLASLKKALGKLELKKILQISMDRQK